MPTKFILAEQKNPYHQHEISPTCVCLICQVASSCSAKCFPIGCNPSLPRKKDILTKGYSPPPPWGSAIRITSPFIRPIITCPEKLFADITETFLAGNSYTPLCSMATRRMRLYGLIREPSIPCADGTYTQEVPLAGIKSEPRMSFAVGDKTVDLKNQDDFVASSARLEPEIKIDKSDVVFVGYGVVAPEYGWNDYKDVDVKGKMILMLIGDPPVPNPKDPSKLDDKMFKGKALTYYGRWTYKYEVARSEEHTSELQSPMY